ncbi:T9SS type A sorting domain-containing protein [Chryseobacterium terrae]|uniref:T9SS type A sorting domain-containing protein n=1 Tax=Chryseobacterium terrae TaxID=3163299 RepID=A0ABW8Y4L5_9FLAO
MRTKSIFFLLMLFLSSLGISLSAQNSILVASSGTNAKKIIQLDATDGTVINSNFIDLSLQGAGFPKGIAQVGDHIWITDQTLDRIYIYTTAGAYVSSITTNLNNNRGLTVVNNNEVWVSNGDTGNGATEDTIVRFSTTGTLLGTYPAPNTVVFDVVDNNNGTVYVSGLDTNGIQKLDYSGVSQGNLVAPGVFQNLQQINLMASGNLLAVVFQTHNTSGNVAGVYSISTANGAILNTWPVSDLRGVIEMGNGNILYTTGTGLYQIDVATGVKTQLLTGSLQFMCKATIQQLAVKEVEKPTYKIFPNPVADFLSIEGDTSIDVIKVFAVDGKLVQTQTVNAKKYMLNVRNLPKGNYLISVGSNGQFTQQKFIKK